jgi:putative ubiquitin-RnfH superfamily antitoxin RatB of RatAB toxin-antitoxin module
MSTENDNLIKVEVAYARPDSQLILEVKVSPDATVEQVISESGILEKFPEIDLAVNKVGIFGKLTKLGNTLREGDRIEIYRKLIADPKEVRRRRAAEGKQMKKGGGSL